MKSFMHNVKQLHDRGVAASRAHSWAILAACLTSLVLVSCGGGGSADNSSASGGAISGSDTTGSGGGGTGSGTGTGSAAGSGTASGGGSGSTDGGAVPPEPLGSVTTLEPDPFDFNTGGDSSGGASSGSSAGGDSGSDAGSASGAGGDSGGVGAGGGLGKTLQVQIAAARIIDGSPLGTAQTGATSGLVKLNASKHAVPFLLTLTGTSSGTYFDEAKNALVTYDPDQPPLHALVSSFNQHLGITALTEAAYRYVINHYVVDPNAVRKGTTPLRHSATAAELSRVTPAQIEQAEETIRAEINRLLPNRYQLDSLETLPTPIDGKSKRGALKDNPQGRMQAVTGGLALVAGRHDPTLDRPAISMVAQLADDLTDGVIDGRRLDGSAVTDGTHATYNPLTLASELTSAADSVIDLLGSLASLPVITAQPLSASVSNGSIAALSVQASGSALSYQWFAGDVAITGAVTPNYSTRTAGAYRVEVANSSGKVTSTTAMVTVSPTAVVPTITRDPQPLSLTLGAYATFTVEAAGTDLAFQWFDANGPLANATSAILKTQQVGTYHVVVSNSVGSARSNDATFVALPLPLPLGAPGASP